MKIIGFAGKKGAGKDTCAAYMQRCIVDGMEGDNRVATLAFATPLKRALSTIFYENFPETEEGKESDIPGFNFTWRHAAQYIGTDCLRGMDMDIWVKHMQKELAWYSKQGCTHALITDVRFPNEVDLIQHLRGHMVYVMREGKAGDRHSSENAIGVVDCDSVILNNGTKDELIQTVNNVYKTMKGMHYV